MEGRAAQGKVGLMLSFSKTAVLSHSTGTTDSDYVLRVFIKVRTKNLECFYNKEMINEKTVMLTLI